MDTGGPAREFWRLLMSGIQSDYCRSGNGGCFFDRNVSAMQVSAFSTVYCVILSLQNLFYLLTRGLTLRASAF